MRQRRPWNAFNDQDLQDYIHELDTLLMEIKNKFPHLSIYAHIGDPKQATLEIDYTEEE